MQKYKIKIILNLYFILSIFVLFFPFVAVKANDSVFFGVIDGVYKYAKGIDSGDVKINFGIFEGSLAVKVTDKNITGFAWGENIGWINLAPSGSGVLNNDEGALSGYATSERGGLVDFKGVTINSSGEFLGYAKSENLGRISFNCSNDKSCSKDDFKVKTDWRSVSSRNNRVPPPSANIPLPAEKPILVELKPVQKEDTHDQDDSNNNNGKPKPLPITDLSQYEGGGDIVHNNNSNELTEKKDTLNTNTNSSVVTENNLVKKEKESIEIKLIDAVNSNSNVQKQPKEISTVVKEIKKEAVVISNSPAVDISTKTVTTVGVAGGGTALFSSALGGALSFSEIALNIFRIWSIFMSAIGLRKKRKPWGTVYDSVTKQPLDPAYVVLQDKDNNEVATAITDIDGRFGFLVPPGVYKIYVRKNNYSFPSKKLFGKDKDELYDNLYFGEYLNFEDNKLIIKNIPMDREKFDWNQFMKRDQKLLKFNSPYHNLFIKISDILFYIGFILTVMLLFIRGISHYNIIMLIFYCAFFFLRKIGIKTRSYGIISEYTTGYPLAFSVIRIFKKDSKEEMLHKVADKYGHYYCLLPKGEYYVSIEKKNADESYTKVFTSENFIINNGILNKSFEIRDLYF